jgi:GNAT superfamily N-acetyltransferase
MDRLTFRRAIASRIGQVLTPALCAAIETDASVMPDLSIPLEQFETVCVGDYVIQAERFAMVLPELKPLHELHWQETEGARHGLTLAPDYDAMAADERAGRLLQFTVRHCGALMGNLRLYVMQSRHSKNLVAVEDTLFIAPAHRGGLLGLKLLRYAEQCLVQIGVREIDANSKLVNGADALMRRMKYTPVAIQFHKIIAP